jgi:hypothetical protein
MKPAIPRLIPASVAAAALALIAVLGAGSGGASAAGHCRPRPQSSAETRINKRKSCPAAVGRTYAGTFSVPRELSPNTPTPRYLYYFQHKTSSEDIRVRFWNLSSVRNCRGRDCTLSIGIDSGDNGGIDGDMVQPGKSKTVVMPNFEPGRYYIQLGGTAYQNHAVKWRMDLISG